MNTHNRFLHVMAALMILALIPLTTCGKDSSTQPSAPETPPPPPTPVATRVEISPSSATLNSIGKTVQLTARVFDQNNAAMNAAVVTWTSSALGVATVSSQGLVAAVSNGSAQITARSGSASASVPVTVMQTAGSIAIEPESATLMSLGETVQLTASVLDGNVQPVAGAEVTWSSSDVSVATVSSQGLVAAVSNGSAQITARSGSASASVPVTVMQSAGSIAIEPESATLMSLGETVQLTTSVLDGNGQPVAGAEATWSSSDAEVATVSSQGLVTAVSNGSAQITARSGSASASVPVTVMQSAGSIAIEPESATLMSLGETVQLTASVLDGNGQPVADAEVTWSSSDAEVATVSGQGLVTAVSNGSAQITARSGSASASVPVTVMQTAGSIAIEPESATLMSLGETVQLTASVLDGNGQPVADAEVTWSSSDAEVATVSGQGLVTAVSNGSAQITARSGSASASVPVTVMQTAGSIAIEPESATLMSLGETVQLTASVLDGNVQPVAGAEVTWSSSDVSVATVSSQGLVTAVSNGSAQITARSGSASASVPVTVMLPLPVPTGLQVSATTPNSITWIWDEIEGGTAYVVQISRNDVFGDEDDVTTLVLMPTHTISGLKPGSFMYIRVASAAGTSIEDADLSEWSNTVRANSDFFSLQIYTAHRGVVPDEVMTVRLGGRLPNLIVRKEFEGRATSSNISFEEATWTSSDPTIIEIGTSEIPRWNGRNIWMEKVIALQAIRTGTVTITATVGSQSDHAFFHVLEEEMVDLSGRSETDRPDDISGPQIHAVYVIPADGIDEQLDLDGTIATSLEATRNWMAQESGRMLRLDTYDGIPDITYLRLSQPHQIVKNDAIGVFIDNLMEAGVLPHSFDLFSSSKVYLIYYVFDEVPTFGAFVPALGGAMAVVSARAPSSFSPSPTAYGPQELTTAHELLHTFGAVEPCAPNWIPGSHVSDEHDVMGTVNPRLARNIRIDIDRDDYYGHGRGDCIDVAQSKFWEPVPSFRMSRTSEPMTPYVPDGNPWVLIRCHRVPH